MTETISPPRFRTEVARTALLAAPLAAGHLSHGLVGFVDTVVAGHHGTATLAAVAVGTALFWLPMMLPMGVLMSLPPAVSQLDGAGRRDEIGPLFRQALWLALALGLLLFGLMTLLPLALAPMGMAADIIPGATDFTHAIRWGIPAFTLYLAMRYLSDGLHWSMPTMVLGFGGLLLLAPLGYVLANGLLGFPELGAVGLGIASALMFWAQAIAFAIYLWRSRRFADLQLFSHWQAPHWHGAARPAAHRPADRGDGGDGGQPVHRHRAADRPPRRVAGGRAPDRDQRRLDVFHDPVRHGRGHHDPGRPCARSRRSRRVAPRVFRRACAGAGDPGDLRRSCC